jgi:hypothetical protein
VLGCGQLHLIGDRPHQLHQLDAADL